ncbi:hypothetical protein EVAR_31426_1 [Eumeta japonica]|uniref:Uncharacterized protein n=1 Tax=Eumeta variegata TaxID=151549 RepID=A0A4C1UXT3_EUMVA|nr:hypothetical protein EVAR_31426_1 [Eumeta japonica]
MSSDVPGPSKHFSTDNSSISVAKKRRKINQDSSLDESDSSSEEAAYSQCNDEDQSDTSEGSGTSIFDIIYDLIQRIEPHLNESPKHWASLTYFVRHVPTFTCYRIANVDRSLVFKFLAAVIIHGALQGQFEVAQEAARLKS